MQTILRIAKVFVALLFGTLILTQSLVAPTDAVERVRAYTRMVEFDYIDWTIDAVIVKNFQESVSAPRYMSIDDQRRVVFEYLNLVHQVNQASTEIEVVFADPAIDDPEAAASELLERLRDLRSMEEQLKPIAESVLQFQVGVAVGDLDLTFLGQPIPPVLYHVTRLPNALIVSPRGVIQQDANISLMPEMTTEEIAAMEAAVEDALDVSALIVPIGGVGTYPTMVMSTTDLGWLLEVISHEWIHNYLTLRPVGMLYGVSGEMRTINETTANLSGKEIARTVMERYYPEMIPPPAPAVVEPQQNVPEPPPPPVEEPERFNYNREMHKTRVQVDALLAEGKIEEAEAYMEVRRIFFWDNGYRIRRLNQAYFAFYGAYDDIPGGGAGGQDPVGPAVRELRQRSASLADFLRRLTWVTSFEQLQRELEKAQ